MQRDSHGKRFPADDKQKTLEPVSGDSDPSATQMPRWWLEVTRLSQRRAWWLQSLAYLFLTIAFTWPLSPRLGSAVPSDLGDPILNTWLLWWNAQHVPLTEAAWNAPAFFPARGVLAFSETLLGISLFTNPLQGLGVSPQFAYNLAFFTSFPLSATCASLLAYELTGRRDAAFIAGLAFGFHPFRVAHFPQLQVLCSYFMPLGLYALHRHLVDGRSRWLILFGAAWMLQGLTNHIRCIVLALGHREMEFPRSLEVSVARDGVAWHQVWRGNAAGEALAASMRDRHRTPIRLVVGDQMGRYIRFRNAGTHDQGRLWSIAELAVYGQRALP